MNAFIGALNEQLNQIRAQGLYRELRRVDSAQGPRITVEGRELSNFSSNDYLGLANDPALAAAAREAMGRFGAGAGASRLVCGSLAPHHDLEQALAEFKGTEAALAFSSGYAAALGTLGALVGKDDVIILDKLAHACTVDAARLCGAKLRVFGHNDLNELEAHLKWADQRQASAAPAPARRARTLIVTESVFSMDGDFAPVRDLVALKDQYGAWLMLDEAHATGLYGNHRRGLAEAWDVAHRVEVHMGTLGKACGAAGGYIGGPRALIDLLVNRARSFIFSTAPPPAMAAAAAAGVRLVQSPEGERRLAQLQERVKQMTCGLPKWASLNSQLSTLHSPLTAPPILPLILGDEARAVSAAAALRERGVFIPAIRYPTVARGAARLRLTVTAAHTSRDVAQLLAALNQLPS
jgi:8-amino-7-oxononanoate synthase